MIVVSSGKRKGKVEIGNTEKENNRLLWALHNVASPARQTMAHSDSEGDEIDDLEFENGTSEAEQDEDAEADDDTLDPLDNDVDDATEGDDVRLFTTLSSASPAHSQLRRPRIQLLRTLTKDLTRTMMMNPNTLETRPWTWMETLLLLN